MILLWSFVVVAVGLSVLDLLAHFVRHLIWRYHWRRDSVRSHRVLMEQIDAVRQGHG